MGRFVLLCPQYPPAQVFQVTNIQKPSQTQRKSKCPHSFTYVRHYPEPNHYLYNYYLDVCWGSTKNGRLVAKLVSHDKWINLKKNKKRQNTQQRITKADKSLLVSLQNSAILLVCKVCQKLPTVYKKTLKSIGNNSWMSSPGVTFNLTCGKGVTELQNLTNLRLSSFAESHQMQQKNFVVSPNANQLNTSPNAGGIGIHWPAFLVGLGWDVNFMLFVYVFPTLLRNTNTISGGIYGL